MHARSTQNRTKRLEMAIKSRLMFMLHLIFFFFQAEDGIRDLTVTGVQTCALPILQSLSATMQSVTGITKNVSFSIASADSLLSSNPNYFAFGNLGGPSGPTFANSLDRKSVV